MKKEIVWIIIALIIGVSYASVEITKIVYKERIRKENLIIEEQQKEIYNLCTRYTSMNAAYLLGKVPSMYDEIIKDEEKDKKECLEKYKLKLFQPEEKNVYENLIKNIKINKE